MAIDLNEVRAKAAAAVTAVDADEGASPVLAAVVRELATKADKAAGFIGGEREWEAVVEVEQAGDSAKVAAEADTGASEPTRSSVSDAHLAICMLKAGYAQEHALA